MPLSGYQGIAQRLYDRVPSVFNQPGRGRVVAESSYVQRCIQSLANFVMSLMAFFSNPVEETEAAAE